MSNGDWATTFSTTKFPAAQGVGEARFEPRTATQQTGYSYPPPPSFHWFAGIVSNIHFNPFSPGVGPDCVG